MNNLGLFWVLAQPGSIFIQLLMRAPRVAAFGVFWLSWFIMSCGARPLSLTLLVLVTVSHASQLLLLETAKSSLLSAIIIIMASSMYL